MAEYDITIADVGATAPNYSNGNDDTINVNILDSANGSLALNGDFQAAPAVDTWNITIPVGATYTLTSLGTNFYSLYINFDNGNSLTSTITGGVGGVSVVCFTRGAMIRTADGLRKIETLGEGDLVETRDGKLKAIRWIGSTPLSSEMLAQFPDLRPVRIAAGALGEHQETLVSPHHRMLLSGWRAELLFGEAEVLAAARSLVNDSTIAPAYDVEDVEYFHILFDDHEIINADGAWSESFHPAALNIGTVSEPTRDEVLTMFPQLETEGAMRAAARPSLNASDVRLLGI